MNSLLEIEFDGSGSVVGQSVVPVLTLNAFCSEHHINHIDILKIDAQGFDFEVIKGAKHVILAGKIRQIYFEIIFFDMYKNLPRFSEIYDFHYQKGVAG